MRGLTARERWLLGACFLVIFVMANFFVIRAMVKVLGGSSERITELENQLADNQMWLEEAQESAAKQNWLDENMPRLTGLTLGRAHGELIQHLQDDLFERKLKIEQQSMQDIVTTEFYEEVAVRLRVRGDEKAVLEWLTTLQGPEKFQVIKSFELELDRRSREPEPQAVCQITIAKWYSPDRGEVEEKPEPLPEPQKDPDLTGETEGSSANDGNQQG